MTINRDAWEEYWQAEKSDLAARYGDFKCSDCIYWYVDDWRVEKAILNNKDLKGDTPRGQCRRKAPIPQPLIGVLTGQLAGSIAWATEAAANLPHDEEDWGTDYHLDGRDVYEIDEWPLTTITAWCGEGKPGRKAMSAETIAKLEALYAKAFPPEQEDDAARAEEPAP